MGIQGSSKSIKKRAGSSDKSGSASKNEFLAFLASYGLDITEEVASVEDKIDKAEEIIKPDETEETRDTEEQAEIEEPIEAPEEVVKVETIEEKLQQADQNLLKKLKIDLMKTSILNAKLLFPPR